MKIEIDDDYADDIVAGTLAESYLRIKDMMKNPKSWHPEDVESWKTLLPAIELVGSHFCTDFKALVKKAKKK